MDASRDDSTSGPVYNRVGVGYDAARSADPYIAGRLAFHVSPGSGPELTGSFLDVACGTGNYTISLSDAGGSWHGVDLSTRMVGAARRKTLSVNWCLARAETLPFADRSFQGAICTLALHHFSDLAPIFREIHRVLDRGKLVLFTADPDQMRSYWLNEYFPESMLKSIEQMPELDRVIESLVNAGFASIDTEAYEVQSGLQDLFLYGGEHRPELYMDQNFRRGISTFSSLAVPGEVERGCGRLARDIESGRISEIINAHSGPGGDYLFVIASKRP